MNEYAFLPAYTDPNLNAGTIQAATLGRLADQSKVDAELRREEMKLRLMQQMNADKQANLNRDQRSQEHAAELLMRTRELDAQREAEANRLAVQGKQVQAQIDAADPEKRAAIALTQNKKDWDNLSRSVDSALKPYRDSALKAKSDYESAFNSAVGEQRQIAEEEKAIASKQKSLKPGDAAYVANANRLVELQSRKLSIKNMLDEYKRAATRAASSLSDQHSLIAREAARLGGSYDPETGRLNDFGRYSAPGSASSQAEFQGPPSPVVIPGSTPTINNSLLGPSVTPIPLPDGVSISGSPASFTGSTPSLPVGISGTNSLLGSDPINSAASRLGFGGVKKLDPSPVAAPQVAPRVATQVAREDVPRFHPFVGTAFEGSPMYNTLFGDKPTSADAGMTTGFRTPAASPVVVAGPPATNAVTFFNPAVMSKSEFSDSNPFKQDADAALASGVKGYYYYKAKDWENGYYNAPQPQRASPVPFRPMSVIDAVNQNMYPDR